MKKDIRFVTSIYVKAFFLPLILLVLIYIAVGVYPFGEKTLLYGDMGAQYADYFSYLHEILTGKADGVYTFSKALGGDMISIWSYYLLSPFNLIFLFFDASSIVQGVHLLMLLKLSFCGLTMSVYLKNGVCGREAGRKKSDIWILIFSTVYALSGYAVSYSYNVMWMDGVYLLPIVILGLERLLERRNKTLYISALAAALIFSYYTAYMICLFLVFYTPVYYLLLRRNRGEKDQFIKTLGAVLFGSAVSIGIAAVLLIPTAKSFSGNAKGNLNFGILTDMSRLFRMRDVLKRFLPGQYTIDMLNGDLPNPYIGLVGVLLCIALLCMRGLRWKEKTAYGILLVILFLSFDLKGLNSLWHICSRPAGITNRFGFLWCFTMISMLCAGFYRLHGQLEKIRYGSVIAGAVGCLWLTEVCMNAWHIYDSYDAASYRDRQKHVETMVHCMEMIHKEESLAADAEGGTLGGLYRVETSGGAHTAVNEPFRFHFRGISSYSSSEKTQTKYIGGRLGYAYKGFWLQYEDGSTLAADSFLGVKYLITTDDLDDDIKIGSYGGISVYKNPYALPFAMWVSEDPAQIQDVYLGEYDLFWIQNQIYMILSGSPEHVLAQMQVENVEAVNLAREGDSSFYDMMEPSVPAYLEYTVRVPQEKFLYVYSAGSGVSRIEVEDREGNVSDYAALMIYDIGRQEAGETVKIRFYLSGDQIDSTDMFFYYMDMDVMDSLTREILDGTITVRAKKDSDIAVTAENTGTVTKYLMFTIPADEGWHAYVDGMEVTIDKGLQTFAMLPIEPGKHEIRMVYRMPGIGMGMWITLISVMVFFTDFYGSKRFYHV